MCPHRPRIGTMRASTAAAEFPLEVAVAAFGLSLLSVFAILVITFCTFRSVQTALVYIASRHRCLPPLHPHGRDHGGAESRLRVEFGEADLPRLVALDQP